MMIDRVGGAGPGYGPKKPENQQQVQQPVRSGDNVSISAEAARAADLARVTNLVRSTDDTSRMEKVKEIKQRLQNGEFDNPSEAMLSSAADSLLGSVLSSTQETTEES